jgi:hypothetical protein
MAETLFVASSRRGNYFLQDIISAIHWAAQGDYYAILVDETGKAPAASSPKCRTVPSTLPLTAAPGFHRAAALQQAMQEGLRFDIAILLDEQCLLINQGIGEWASKQLSQDSRLGLLGVQSCDYLIEPYRNALPLLYEWDISHARWEKPPTALSGLVLIATYMLCEELRRREWLVPDGCQRWSTTYGAYMSWTAQMADFLQIAWGRADKPLPPLFVQDCDLGSPTPPIYLDRRMFHLFAPANRALSFSEMELRDVYKRDRGEQVHIPPFSPTVSAPPV